MSRVRGMSLVEVIVSLSLLSAVLIFVLNLYPISLTTLRRAEFDHEIEARARDLLEFYAVEPALEWPVGSRRNLPDQTVRETTMQAELEVLAYAPCDPQMLVQMRLQLRWEERGQGRRLIRESLVSRFEN